MQTRWIAPVVLAAMLGAVPATAAIAVPEGPANATIDLMTREGVAAVRGVWRYSDTKIVEVPFRSPGPDLKPSGPPNTTYDFTPHAGAADFEDAGWEAIDPTTLPSRRSTGKLCFNWYRINITIPEKIGDFETTGATVVFEMVVDDYAEVWVDGKLPRELGQSGGALIKGWNAPNRLVIAEDAQPGRKVQLAVFGINGPISDTPSNFIWVRKAKLDFYKEPKARALRPVPFTIDRRDAALDRVVPPGSQIEKLAEGFLFTEGPVWTGDGLLFSDPNRNRIYRWTPAPSSMLHAPSDQRTWSMELGAWSRLSVFRERSGYSGDDIGEYGQPGSNGLALDRQGRLTICEHGNRRVTRLEKDGSVTVLADRYQGKRLNSPNDLVYRSDGTLYFTDPPFGLPKFHDDPRRELPYTGVYSLRNGKLRLVSADLKGPNGLAFSPDERVLYVTNWDEKKKVVMRYEARPDGTLANGRVFFDMTAAPGEEALDGIKVDRQGNLFVSGPGGVWVISPAGKHLGTIRAPMLPANLAWGENGRTLYLTARTGLYRMRLGREP
jgi:gluconolactonase